MEFTEEQLDQITAGHTNKPDELKEILEKQKEIIEGFTQEQNSEKVESEKKGFSL